MSTNTDAILLQEILTCEEVMACLTGDVKQNAMEFLTRIEKERKGKESRLKESEHTKAQREAEEFAVCSKYLCSNHWGEKVPDIKRFAICKRLGKRFEGYCGQENYPNMWEAEVQFCAIDLVRGYMAPYWGYYGGFYSEYDKMMPFFKNKILPILNATSDFEKATFIQGNFDFFSIIEKSQINPTPFHIINYEIVSDGEIKVIDESPARTWEEHRELLKAEYAA